MTFNFASAKNGTLTCSCDGKFLHSSYNPENEAKSFVQNLEPTFCPSTVFIVEGALSYCVPFLRHRFPQAKLVTIRLFNKFTDYDKDWDKVFYFSSSQFFDEELFNYFGEEELLKSAFFTWKPVELNFPQIVQEVFESIKKAVSKSRDVLYTRSYFARRWFTNSINNICLLKSSSIINKIEKGILICASGPSLKESIEYIKKYRESFFIIAVSSAVSVLEYYSIPMDMVLSTDGGYWAKKHIEFDSLKSNPLWAVTDEAACPSALFNKASVMPLIYPESTGQKLFDALKIPYHIAQRNGTVSGTALELAMSLTDKNIYFAGLDLQENKAFQHTQPNKLELINQNKDKKLSNKETRITRSRFGSDGSLALYRNWFKTLPESSIKRVFRITCDNSIKGNIAPVKDIFWDEINLSAGGFEPEIKTQKIELNKSEILKAVQNLSRTETLEKELFPLEVIQRDRSTDSTEKEKIQNKINEKKQKLLKKIGERING